MDVKITVEYIAKNVLAQNDINSRGFPDLEEAVKSFIRDEGLFEIVEDNYKIIKIEEIKKNNK